MKNKMMLLGAAAALCLSASAQATPDGWYLGLEGGGNWVKDWKFQTTDHGTLGQVDFDAGWAVLATVGYGFGNWAVEFESGYRSNKVSQFTTDNAVQTSLDEGHLNETTFMANVKYIYPLTQQISLSLGAGAGVDHSKLQIVTTGGSNNEDANWAFAYQGIAQVGYAIGQQSEVFLSYRYFRTESQSFDYRNTWGAVWDGDNFEKHTATIGFRYYLGNAPSAEPMTAPPPNQPAEPAGAPSEFIIFFGHNKSDLTPQAMDVVKEAAKAAKDGNIANVKLIGHTDRSGSDTYNQALSLRRAKAVKTALVGQGVADGSISMEAKGESEPLVPTADGVREPQNRRVNISF
jgi:outer membrane protein OmpA-like peptidoglycan-associated protein